MDVNIDYISKDSIDTILEITPLYYTDIVVPKSKTNINRLIRLYVKRKDPILKTCFSVVTISCSLLVYIEILNKCSINSINERKIDINKLSFSLPDSSQEFKTELTGIVKKTLLAAKKFVGTEQKSCLSMIPLCSVVSFSMIMNFLECFSFISKQFDHHISDDFKLISSEAYRKLELVLPEVFSKSNLEVYMNL